MQCGPRGLDGEGDLLFHNRGDGTFEEVSKKAGVQDAKGYNGLGVMWVDYDDDGWPDLFVANDATPNYLYHNNHNGTFTDVGPRSPKRHGVMSSMGVDFPLRSHGRLVFARSLPRRQIFWPNIGRVLTTSLIGIPHSYVWALHFYMITMAPDIFVPMHVIPRRIH